MTEAVKSLAAEEALQQIGNHIDAYLKGGPDLEADDIVLAQQLGLNIKSIMAKWADAKEYRLFICPSVQPKVEQPPKVELLKVEPPKHMAEPEGKVADEGWGKRRSWGGEDEVGPSASKADEDEAPTQPKREELFRQSSLTRR